jgi:hypothetical protein
VRPGEWAQQGGQQGAVGGLEPDTLVAELALQHGDLVAQDEDLGVLAVIAAGQQPQQREHVGHTEVGQSQQHEAASSRSHGHRSSRCQAEPAVIGRQGVSTSQP